MTTKATLARQELARRELARRKQASQESLSRVDLARGNRDNMWKALGKELLYNPLTNEELPLSTKLYQLANKPTVTAAKAVGAAGQTAENAIAGAWMGKQLTPDYWKGMAGEKPYEIGDLGREAGLPEPLAAAAGLAGSVALPEAGVMRSLAPLASNITRRLALSPIKFGFKAALKQFVSKSGEAVDYIFERGGEPLFKYAKEGGLSALRRLGIDIHNTVSEVKPPAGESMHTVASKTYDNLKEFFHTTGEPLPGPIARQTAVSVKSALERASETDFNDVAKLEQTIINIPSQGKISIGEILELAESGYEFQPSVWYNVLMALKGQAKTTAGAMEAVEALGDNLKSFYPEMAHAADTWSAYSAANRSKELLVGKPGRTGYFSEEHARNIANYFDSADAPRGTRQAVDDLDANIARFNQLTGSQIPGFKQRILDVSAIQGLDDTKLHTMGLAIGGGAAVAARKVNVPEALVGAGMGTTLAASSPKALAQGMKAYFRVRSQMLKATETPFWRVSSQVLGQMSAEGLGRTLTGRNSIQEE